MCTLFTSVHIHLWHAQLPLCTFILTYVHICLSRSTTISADGTPFDGVPIEEDVTVSVALTVIYGLLATAGIAFTIACLIFNFVFREKK